MAKKSVGIKDRGDKHTVDRGDSGKVKSRPGTSVSVRAAPEKEVERSPEENDKNLNLQTNLCSCLTARFEVARCNANTSETYVAIAENDLMTSFRNLGKGNSTELSKFICSLEDNNIDSSTSFAPTKPYSSAKVYTPSGDFEKDYNELCHRIGIEPVRIVPRPHPPVPSLQLEAPNIKAEKSKRDHAQTPLLQHHHQQQPAVATRSLLPEGYDQPPTTFFAKEKYEYFKPRIEVEVEEEGGISYIKELFIRGWKVDAKLIEVFGMTLPRQDRLTTIDLWNSGLLDETLELLAKVVSSHQTLRHLRLDGNGFLILQRFDEFLKEDSKLHSLSLKNCYVNDIGAEHLGTALSSNKNLLVLNLCFNKITCAGVEHLAKGLRLNRTLLSLNLGSNRIGNSGAIKLAQTISKFPLSHEEVVARRLMLAKGNTSEELRPSSPTRSLATTGSKENRPPSVKSGLHVNKDDKKKDKGGSKKKDQQAGRAGKDTPASKRGGGSNIDSGVKGGSKSGKKVAAVKQEKGRQSQTDTEQQEFEFLHPYLETVEEINKELWIPGNRALVNLNLARNDIGEAGLQAFLEAVKYQSEVGAQANRTCGIGLMRLSLQRNAFPVEDPNYVQLQEIMSVRDPFYKPTSNTPSTDSLKDDN